MELAAFYSAVTGRPVTDGSDEEWAGIQFGEIELAFIRDIDVEQERVIALGATLEEDSIDAEGYGWRVYADPIGHLFCLCRNKRVTWTEDGPVWH